MSFFCLTVNATVRISSFGFKTNPNTILHAKLILTKFINYENTSLSQSSGVTFFIILL